ncbi:hypothetical protein ABZS61_20475 [Streptomyces sp. NPDC005566]|uniref:hypothetical protein n=1 Tax=Streptomyces sp. NPDC005566 TaxID=3156886 RepID=UPI0033BE149D
MLSVTTSSNPAVSRECGAIAPASILRFQEENGLYDFDRKPKFDIARIRTVQTAEAAYERPEGNRGTALG